MRAQYQSDAMFKMQCCPLHVQYVLVDQPLLMFVMFFSHFSFADTSGRATEGDGLGGETPVPREGLVSTLRCNCVMYLLKY